MQTRRTASEHTMNVMVVGGGPDVLPRVEPLLPAGAYEVEFVALDQEPYGCITDVPPDLLVVCLRIEDAAGFQFLSMLQMDPATRRIPVLTYTTEAEGQMLPGVDDVPARRFTSRRGPHRLARH
jgi:CheY-like chemotaxis protein